MDRWKNRMEVNPWAAEPPHISASLLPYQIRHKIFRSCWKTEFTEVRWDAPYPHRCTCSPKTPRRSTGVLRLLRRAWCDRDVPWSHPPPRCPPPNLHRPGRRKWYLTNLIAMKCYRNNLNMLKNEPRNIVAINYTKNMGKKYDQNSSTSFRLSVKNPQSRAVAALSPWGTATLHRQNLSFSFSSSGTGWMISWNANPLDGWSKNKIFWSPRCIWISGHGGHGC